MMLPISKVSKVLVYLIGGVRGCLRVEYPRQTTKGSHCPLAKLFHIYNVIKINLYAKINKRPPILTGCAKISSLHFK